MVVCFVKRRMLEFKHGILWMVTSIVMVIASLNKGFVGEAASFIGISYPPAFLFLIGIMFTLFILFYITVEISKTQRKIIRLTQEVGIIRQDSEEAH
jgi:Uncharacterized conserved protein